MHQSAAAVPFHSFTPSFQDAALGVIMPSRSVSSRQAPQCKRQGRKGGRRRHLSRLVERLRIPRLCAQSEADCASDGMLVDGARQRDCASDTLLVEYRFGSRFLIAGAKVSVHRRSTAAADEAKVPSARHDTTQLPFTSCSWQKLSGSAS